MGEKKLVTNMEFDHTRRHHYIFQKITEFRTDMIDFQAFYIILERLFWKSASGAAVPQAR